MNQETFTDVYRGGPPHIGNFDTPAGAMPAGIGVVRSTATVAKAGRGIIPEGFLNSEVTTDGSSYEEDLHVPIDSRRLMEVKVSEGKVQVIGYQPGVYYITKGNILAGVTFAVDEYILMAADGEFSDIAGATSGDIILGVVSEIDVHHMGMDDCIVWQAVAGLGSKS